MEDTLKIISIILSVVAVAFGGILAAWLKVTTSRAFTAMDKLFDTLQKELEAQIGSVKNTCAEHDALLRAQEKDLVRMQEFRKNAEQQLEQVRADVVREAKLQSDHLDVIHRKMDSVEEKVGKRR